MERLDATERRRAARAQILRTFDTIRRTRDCLLKNHAIAEQMLVRYQRQLQAASDPRSPFAIRHAFLMERLSAALWISHQLLEASSTLVETSRSRVAESLKSSLADVPVRVDFASDASTRMV